MSGSELRSGTRRRSIDLNADLGEGCGTDRALLMRISSASIGCGAHAGDPATIRDTLQAARDRNVAIGAHPGYPDREGFGRRERKVTAAEVEDLILEQAAWLRNLAGEEGLTIRFLKPHGALYNQAQRDGDVARGVLAAASRLGLPLLGQPGTLLEARARGHGVHFIAEGFPDRRYRDDGSLVPRGEPGAVLHDPAAIEASVERLVSEGRVATLCIHGDEPAAVANADRIRSILTHRAIDITNFLA
jgi:5-oxoprolinase (ATP-hydrolysing) subunit A